MFLARLVGVKFDRDSTSASLSDGHVPEVSLAWLRRLMRGRRMQSEACRFTSRGLYRDALVEDFSVAGPGNQTCAAQSKKIDMEMIACIGPHSFQVSSFSQSTGIRASAGYSMSARET
jgi:hypothetical protein